MHLIWQDSCFIQLACQLNSRCGATCFNGESRVSIGSVVEKLRINEVAPRDGLQSQPRQVSCDDKLRLISALVDAGVAAIEATSFVSPKAVPQMADASELFPRLPDPRRIRYSALVPNERGLERAHQAGVREFAVVLSATETMNRRNINMGLPEATNVCASTLAAGIGTGMTGKAYVAVAFACPFEGLVAEDRVIDLTERMFAAGAVEVVIADTIGAAAPRAVGKLLHHAVRRFGAERLSLHLHDTRGFALANAWAAMEEGIRGFDTSVGGLGGCPFAPGAAGNLATEDLVLMAEQCGFDTGIDIAKLRLAMAVATSITGASLGGRTAQWLCAEDARRLKNVEQKAGD
ncbi:MAG: hydroxymethylglutaryl-CoA lyase [Rhodocyclaceae bacterium]|nr:hydroxymethylglutaryl-CoA lyase [Rhodocyclaceae bacterium]